MGDFVLAALLLLGIWSVVWTILLWIICSAMFRRFREDR